MLVALGLVASACARSSAGETLDIAGVQLTEAEFVYGMDVEPDPSVAFADDVVVVPNGSRAARGVTGDGLTWTLDPDAPGVDRLQVGAVMFLTSRGVGRVVGVEEDGEDLLVTIAPVDITEVIWEGEFGGEDIVLDLDQMITYDTGEQPWTVSDLPPTEDPEEPRDAVPTGPGPRRSLVRVDQTDSGSDPVVERVAPPRPSWGGARETSAGDYRVIPICCDGGVGTRITYDKNGLRLVATVQLIGSMPRASWHLKISAGRIERAEFQIHGGVGLSYRVEAGSETGIPSNVHHRFTLPTTLSFPAVAGGVPFSFTVRQEMLVRTAFSAKNSTISAHGVWSFSGAYGFGYRDGRFGLHQPSAPVVNRSLLDSIDGASVGVTGLVLGHRLELKVGIGWEVFSIGPYAEMISSIGLTRGSDLGAPLVVCEGANLNMWLGYGIGYRLPQVVVEVINFVLRVFGAKTIAVEGSIGGERHHIIQRTAWAPEAKICQP